MPSLVSHDSDATRPRRRHEAAGAVTTDMAAAVSHSQQHHNNSSSHHDHDDVDDDHHDDSDTPDHVDDADALRADVRRFAVGPIFCLLSVINAMQWIAFSPIVDEVRVYFHMNANQVNFLANTYVIAYVVIVFLSCKLYEVTGIKLGLCVAAVTNALGAALKVVTLYAYPNAALLYVAQALNSVTEVLVIATPPLIANRWYPARERAVANTVLSSALNFGCGVGVLLPTFFVGPGRDTRGHFAGLFWLHFGLSALSLLLVVFAFPRRPRSFASYTAQRQQGKEEARLRTLRAAFRATPPVHDEQQQLQRQQPSSTPDDDGDDGAQRPAGRAREDNEASVVVAVTRPARPLRDAAVARSDHHGSSVDVSDAAHEPAASVLTVATAPASADKGVYTLPVDAAASSSPRRRRRHGDYNDHITTTSKALDARHRTSDDDDDDHDDDDDDTLYGDGVARVNVFSVLVDCYRECRRNVSFVLLAVAAAAELGLIWAVATVLPQMLSPYRVSEAVAGWVGFCNLVLGTVLCPFGMPLVERCGRHYKYILCALALLLVVNLTALTLLLHYGPAVTRDNQTYYVVVTFVCWGGVAGLCQNAMMPLMFEYVVELTFPLAESTAAPLLTWSACLTNFVLALVFGAVLTDHPSEAHALRVFIGATVVTAVGAAALCGTRPLRKRSEYERRRRDERERLLAAHRHRHRRRSNEHVDDVGNGGSGNRTTATALAIEGGSGVAKAAPQAL